MDEVSQVKEGLAIIDKALALHPLIAAYFAASRAGLVSGGDRAVCTAWVVDAAHEALDMTMHLTRLLGGATTAYWRHVASSPLVETVHLTRLLGGDTTAYWRHAAPSPLVEGTEARAHMSAIGAALIEVRWDALVFTALVRTGGAPGGDAHPRTRAV
jgi:hypothetical protein